MSSSIARAATLENPRDSPLWSDGGAASQVFVHNVNETSHFLEHWMKENIDTKALLVGYIRHVVRFDPVYCFCTVRVSGIQESPVESFHCVGLSVGEVIFDTIGSEISLLWIHMRDCKTNSYLCGCYVQNWSDGVTTRIFPSQFGHLIQLFRRLPPWTWSIFFLCLIHRTTRTGSLVRPMGKSAIGQTTSISGSVWKSIPLTWDCQACTTQRFC
jgi:hypothetical protein